jgi:hypothetical protein
MMQATTSLSLTLPVMTCLPVWFRSLTRTQYLTHGESPLTRGITRDPSLSTQKWLVVDVRVTHAEIIGPQVSDLSHGCARPIIMMVET